MGKPLLYLLPLSPPVRSVLLTAKVIGLELDTYEVDFVNQEHLSEKFLKLNPQHTVPVLDDNGSAIYDSHAICTYLIDKYAPDHKLYPKDLVQRALINQCLHFDSGVLFVNLRNANGNVYHGGSEVPDDKIAAIHEGLQLLETFLKESDYLVGSSVTVADICALTTVTTGEMHFPIEEAKYPKILAWIKRLSQLPNYEELVVKANVDAAKFFNGLKAANAAAKK